MRIGPKEASLRADTCHSNLVKVAVPMSWLPHISMTIARLSERLRYAECGGGRFSPLSIPDMMTEPSSALLSSRDFGRARFTTEDRSLVA